MAGDVVVLNGDEIWNLGFFQAWIRINIELRQDLNPIKFSAS